MIRKKKVPYITIKDILLLNSLQLVFDLLSLLLSEFAALNDF